MLFRAYYYRRECDKAQLVVKFVVQWWCNALKEKTQLTEIQSIAFLFW